MAGSLERESNGTITFLKTTPNCGDSTSISCGNKVLAIAFRSAYFSNNRVTHQQIDLPELEHPDRSPVLAQNLAKTNSEHMAATHLIHHSEHTISIGYLKRKKGLAITAKPLNFLAERTGLEPATPGVTGQYSNQLNYRS